MSRSSRREQKALAQCLAFNERVPVGSPVIVTKDDGREVQSRVRTAYVMCDTPVVMLEGISGCYLLERVRAAQGCGSVTERSAPAALAGHA